MRSGRGRGARRLAADDGRPVVARGAARRPAGSAAGAGGRGSRRRRRRSVHDGAAGAGAGGCAARSPRRSCDPGGRCPWPRPRCATWHGTGRSRHVVGLALPGGRSPGRWPPDRRRATGRPTGRNASGPRAGVPATSTRSSGDGSTGGVTSPGRVRSGCARRALVDGEAMSPLQRLLTCVDSASGVSAMLDVRDVGVPQHRADRARAPRAGRRMDLPGRGDHSSARARSASPPPRRTTSWDRSRGRPRRCWCSGARQPDVIRTGRSDHHDV